MTSFHQIQRILLSAILLCCSATAFANDSSRIRFILHPGLDSNRLTISVHDGIQEQRLKLNETHTWSGRLFSPYGHIFVAYPGQDTAGFVKRIFFSKGNTIVSVTPGHSVNEPFHIDEKVSKNILFYEKMGGAQLDAYVKEKVDSQMAFYYRNKSRFGADGNLVQQMFDLGDTVLLKKLEFIRQHPSLYASFWNFMTNISRTEVISPDSMLATYNKIFPEKYKTSKAAEYMVTVLHNKIAITTQSLFPEFSVTDINNNTITSESLRGQYVLIQFWASWCMPCIKEMPVLKGIHEKYRQAPIKILSISVDQNAQAFRTAITKHAMNWTQVHGDLRLYHAMGYTPIPQLYLLDKTGHVVYNNLKGTDIDLRLLQSILSEKLPD